MPTYTLIEHGDALEQTCYPLFLQAEFPSYETFWQREVVPLTNRPTNIFFKNEKELKAIGKGSTNICIAQLHYSVLNHLYATFRLKQIEKLNLDQFMEGIIRLCGAQDVAFDFLERCTNPTDYGAWVVSSKSTPKGSKEAHFKWQKDNEFPLQSIRNYRNILVHGRLLPSISGDDIYLPDIGKETSYLDWRIIMNNPEIPRLVVQDFQTTKELLEYCWTFTIQYFEEQWQSVM
jgi:hypothetical protein